MTLAAHTAVHRLRAALGLAVLCLAALCLCASTAGAVTLRYEAPPGCPPPDALRAALAEALGAADPDATLVVEVAPDRRSAHLALIADDGRVLGRRTVESPAADCAALVRAAGLSGGLALAPLAEPAPPPPAEPAPPPPAPEAPIEWGIVAGGGLGLATQPGAALVLDAGLWVGRGPWSGVVEVQAAGAPGWVDAEVPGGRVRSGRLAGALRGCGSRWSLDLCLGVLGGVEAHQGADFGRDRSSVGPWLAGSARLDWRIFGAWGPRVELLAPIGRVALTVDGEAVWTTPPLGAVLGLGGRF